MITLVGPQISEKFQVDRIEWKVCLGMRASDIRVFAKCSSSAAKSMSKHEGHTTSLFALLGFGNFSGGAGP